MILVNIMNCLRLVTQMNNLIFLIEAKTIRLIESRNNKGNNYFLLEDNLLISVMDNICFFYDLKNIEGKMVKCIKLNDKYYDEFHSKI
jgi:hypothetical protein